MKRAVILFTRIPVPGKTKTRLMPYFQPVECAELHVCFLRDIAAQIKEINADVFVFYAGTGTSGRAKDEAKLKKIFGESVHCVPQEGDGLGERMYRAICEVLEQGYDSCVLAGTDIPQLKRSDLEYAFRLLDVHDVVFGPTEDGGYYLTGMKRPVKEVFENQTYGHGSVLEQTVRALSEKQVSVGFAHIRSDIDTREDIQKFRAAMRRNPGLQKTETGKYLLKKQKISVIVPIYNEERTIESLQRQLKPLAEQCEILFVDGGSTDRTVSLIDPQFQILHAPKGRAKQMNLGAKKSSGDILFFLHSDSELPKHPLAEIRYVMKDHEAGCFGIAFHSANFFMWTCRVISNHRIRDRKVMFGDQGIFVDRDLFFRAGMFPELPIMEDYQFSLTLKEMGIRLGIAKHRIYTSDRRFPKKTVDKLRVMWKMNRLRKMYRDGVPIGQISDLYRDVR